MNNAQAPSTALKMTIPHGKGDTRTMSGMTSPLKFLSLGRKKLKRSNYDV